MEKTVHTIVLDAGPIIRNDPSVSSLLSEAEVLVTIPEVITEIRDASTRARVTSTLIPFLTLRNPAPESLKFAKDFARQTGDLSVLSNPDIRLIALAHEIECERNGGDWRLKKTPGQKRTNGPSPGKARKQGEGNDVGAASKPKDRSIAQIRKAEQKSDSEDVQLESVTHKQKVSLNDGYSDQPTSKAEGIAITHVSKVENEYNDNLIRSPSPLAKGYTSDDQQSVTKQMARLEVERIKGKDVGSESTEAQSLQPSESLSDTDSDDWITPSNLRKKQEIFNNFSSTSSEQKTPLQVAMITADFSIQNVLLQMNLNLLSPSLKRIKHLKTFVLRCHACFNVTKDMNRQFCLRCGQPSLTKVSCSTTQHGGLKLHLKKNMQWNTRGDRYSIPKPVSGSANGRVNNGGGGKGGGKGGWGQKLILTEDQKEYTRANQQNSRKGRNLMDDDFLPSILSGERNRSGGRPKVGAGRNINSRKRR